MAINVGSVEVDVVPNTRGIYGRLQAALVPPAAQIGDEVGRIIGRQLAAHIAPAVRDSIQAGGRAARPAAVRQGQQTGSAFARSLKATLQAAMANLPEIRLHANSTPAQRELAQLRAQMQALSDARIGIDISSADALAAITQIQARLDRLSADDADVQVRVDAGAASAQLAALQAQVNRLDGQTARVDVDSNSVGHATSRVAILVATALTLGPALLPVLPIAAAGLGAIAAASVAAAAGLGGLAAVAAPAFVNIAGALQAQKAAQDAATSSTLRGAQASGQGASKALQMAGAQQALAAAERNGARQIAQAQDQVRQAKQAVADAVAQAAVRNERAARQIQDAERDLADAQRDAKKAQEELTEARREAADELEDLNNRLASSELSQRDAEIALKEATTERDKVLKNAKSSELDRQKAILAYDQAVQRLKEQTTETERLKEETAAANKAGVKGSDTYKNAQERVAEAQRQVADRTRAVRDAQDEAARTQLETARQVAQAQERVSEATANVAVAQQNAADAVASAQRQIASASQSAAGGVDQAALAQAKYQEALAKLTPAARATFDAFIDLRSAFSEWSKALQPAVMPLFTRALVGLKNSLPGLTPFVLAAAKAVGDLQDRVSRGFKSPWWIQFRDELADSVYPAIFGLGIAFGRIFKGMAGIIDAFLPHMDSISTRMQDITGRFANWGTGLKGSPAFESFLRYSAETGPVVAETFGDIASAFFEIGHSLAPVSGPLLKVLGLIASAIASIAETLPWLVQGLYLVYVATKLWTVALAIQAAVLNAHPLVRIALLIVALVAAVIYAYKHFEWFRDIVNGAWEGIKTAALFVWNNVLKPTFKALTVAVEFLGDVFSWLWKNVLSPAIDWIIKALKILFVIWVVLTFGPIIIAVKFLASIFMWLWKTILKPAIEGIAALFVWLWKTILKPTIDLMIAGFKVWWEVLKFIFGLLRRYILGPLADVFRWIYSKVIKPAFDHIVDAISWAWKHGIKPAFDGIKKALGPLKDAFKVAVEGIGKIWAGIKEKTRGPVQFLIDVIYNNGIKKVWDTVAKFVGLDKLPKVTFGGGGKSGGIDYSGKPQMLAAGGTVGGWGAAVPMVTNRPTAIVGEGNPRYPEYVIPTDPKYRGRAQALHAAAGTQLMASGGVLGDVFGGLTDVAKRIGGAVMSGFDFIANPGKMWDKATGFIKDKLRSIGESQWAQAVGRVPLKILKGLKGKIVDAATGLFDFGGKAAGSVGKAMAFAKAQAGKPYLWGGVGPAGYDCSGFMSAIQNVILGRKAYQRAWATMSFAGGNTPPGWKKNFPAPFRVGITHAGVGHTAGTLGGVNVESRGGRGVVIGSAARGYRDPLFSDWYGFTPSVSLHDDGGWIPPGGFGFNGLSSPEAVLTPRQFAALEGAAQAGIARGGDSPTFSYTINARTADFTTADLDRVQRVQEARARAGRRR